MEQRGVGGRHYQHAGAAAANVAAATAATSTSQNLGHDYHRHEYDYMTAEEQRSNSSSFDNPTTTINKKKPPKLKSINRSISMAIDNYAPMHVGPFSAGSGGMPDNKFIIEQPLIHRSASPLPMRATSPPQTLNLPTQYAGGGSGAVSPSLSSRQKHHMQTFQHLATQSRHHSQQHSSSTSSPTLHGISSKISGGGISATGSGGLHQQPDIYLVSSTSLGNDNVLGGGSGNFGGSTSPIQFIDDFMLPSTHHTRHDMTTSVTHPLKKTHFRRSDTIDVHPASTFQMKKTHSFHVQHDAAQVTGLVNDPLLLSASGGGSGSQQSSGASSRRTSSVRANFLMPGQTGNQMSRSPSPSRRGYRSHRSFNDPQRRPSNKPENEIRHPSLNDDLIETLDGVGMRDFSSTNRSLENELFIETGARSNSHTQMDDIVSMEHHQQQKQQQQRIIRKSSGSFEENVISAHNTGTHPPVSSSSSSLKKREIPHARQHSTHSLDIDGRPTVTTAAVMSHAHAPPPTLQLHSAAAAAQAAFHFKRGAQQGRSLYLSPNNLEELPFQRSGVLAASAAAAFQGTNVSASVKQARALHSASMRLRTYRETLSASKKSKSFIADGGFPPSSLPLSTVEDGNDFELTSPHRRNSRPLSSSSASVEPTIDDIKRSPRPIVVASTSTGSAAASAFIEEKRPSFERKSSLTYELSDAAFEQVLRPFHHKVAGRKSSMTGSHKAMNKKSLSDETDDDEEADRKRKRIVCIVMTVFLCLVCASVLVVILTLTHSSGQSHTHHQTTKKIYTFTRETPVHYNGMIDETFTIVAIDMFIFLYKRLHKT